MNKSNETRLCILCSHKSIERRRKRVVPWLISNKEGLVCGVCNRFSCLFCLSSIIKSCNESQYEKAIGASKVWLNQVNEFIMEQKEPREFIGHCCYLKRSPNIINNVLKPASTREVCDKSSMISLAGCIYFPEFRLIVDSPINCVDIHGLGREGSGKNNLTVDPVWHCVLKNDFPRPRRNLNDSRISTERVTIYMEDPHNTSKWKKEYDIYIMVVSYDEKHEFDKKMKGTNTPKNIEIEESFMVTSEFHPAKNTDDKIQRVICIFGSKPNRNKSLLLFRFVDLNPRAGLSKNSEDDLYHFLFENKISSRKQELRRNGGSSCETDSSTREFNQMLMRPGNVPRRADGTVWIQERLCWKLYYIGVNDGLPKSLWYSQPVNGGAFSIGHWNQNKTVYKFNDSIKERKIFKNYPALMRFCESKPLAALLLDELRNHGFQCMPEAVNTELKHILVARNHVANLPKQCRKNEFYLFYMRYVNFTMVMHPVGFHLDVFANRDSILENKAVFIRHDIFEPGRGGGGPNIFTWALLDW